MDARCMEEKTAGALRGSVKPRRDAFSATDEKVFPILTAKTEIEKDSGGVLE